MLDKAAEEGKGGGPASRASPVACWRPPFLASGAPGDSRCPCGPMEKQVLGRLERFATTLPMQAGGDGRGDSCLHPCRGSCLSKSARVLIPASLSVYLSLSLAYPCSALDFHLKSAEGDRNRDLL